MRRAIDPRLAAMGWCAHEARPARDRARASTAARQRLHGRADDIEAERAYGRAVSVDVGSRWEVSLQIGMMLVEAFASWRELEVDFDRQGLVLITGPSGSGKSSLFQALYWSLFAEPYKAVHLDQLVNHRLKKNCCVKTSVNTLSIERYRKHQMHHDRVRLFRGATDMTCPHARETQARFERLTGISKEAFLGLSYVDGRGTSQFLDATRAERGKALDQMFGLDALARCATYARQQASSQAAQLQALAGELAYHHRQLEAEAGAARERSRASQAETARLQQVCVDTDAALTEVHAALEAARDELRSVQHGLARLEAEIRQQETETQPHRQTRVTLQQLVGEACPHCLRPFASRDLPPLDQKLAADIAGLEASIVSQQQALADRAAAAQVAQQRVSDLDGARSRLLTVKAEAQSQLQALEAVDTTARLRQIQEDIIRLRANTVPLRRSEQYYRFWAESFGPEGMRVEFLATLADVLADRLATYATFFPGLQISSQVSRGTIQTEASIDGGGTTYQEMSSGERTLAQMVMGLALRDLTALRYPGAACNVLLFDEVMGTIDLGRVEQTVQFFQSVLTGAVNTILCISHRAELKEYFPLIWQVRKDEFSELHA